MANGVTGVRDMGGLLGSIDELRTKIAAGRLTGPRIVRAGPTLNGKAFNPLQMVAGSPEEVRGVIRTLKHVVSTSSRSIGACRGTPTSR